MRQKLLRGCEKKIAAVFLIMMELLQPVARRDEFCKEVREFLIPCDAKQLKEMGLQGSQQFFFT